jgi:predicted kinase
VHLTLTSVPRGEDQAGSETSLLLVATSGLAGVGKSTLARLIARELPIALIELDRIEDPLLKQGISGDSLGWAGYEILTALAEDNLGIGQSVLLDSVCWTRAIRKRWADLAERHGARYRPIEIVCSDVAVHRERVESRGKVTGWQAVDWQRVEEAQSRFEPWEGPRLLLDSIRSIDELLATALAYVRG